MDLRAALRLQFPVRCTAAQKQSARAYLAREFGEAGFLPITQRTAVLSLAVNNLVCGSVAASRIVLLAAADTPRLRVFAARRYPHSPLLSAVSALLPMLLLAALCAAAAYLGFPPAAAELLLMVMLFATHMLFACPHSAGRDAALIAMGDLAERCRGRAICFVLLDGSPGLGRRAFLREYGAQLDGKLIVELGALARGELLCARHDEGAAAAARLTGENVLLSRGRKKASPAGGYLRLDAAARGRLGPWQDAPGVLQSAPPDETAVRAAVDAAVRIIEGI